MPTPLSPDDLARQARFIFRGTVERLRAVTMADVPVTNRWATTYETHIDEIAAVGHCRVNSLGNCKIGGALSTLAKDPIASQGHPRSHPAHAGRGLATPRNDASHMGTMTKAIVAEFVRIFPRNRV